MADLRVAYRAVTQADFAEVRDLPSHIQHLYRTLQYGDVRVRHRPKEIKVWKGGVVYTMDGKV
jgi:hypothetical protein